MPTLQVRDLPQNLYDGLKARAKVQHRSLAQETIVAIEAYLSSFINTEPFSREVEMPASYINFEDDYLGREARIAKRKALFEEIHNAPKIEIPDDFPSVVELIREGREERDVRFGL